MNKYIVTFDKSNEDIPTLVVAREPFFSINPSVDIIRVFTGARAERLWNALDGKAKSEE